MIEGLGSKNYDKVFGSLTSWNVLLPADTDENKNPKYRIRISDALYKEATKIISKVECPNCNEQTDYHKIIIFDLLVPIIVQTITREKFTKAWICPHCKKDNKMKNTIILESRLQEGGIIGVVPSYPKRRDGLNDRGKYHRNVVRWAWTFITELEASTAKYRDDYKPESEDGETAEFEGGEEEM